MHCATCTCESRRAVHFTVYGASTAMYGDCETCGQPRWVTELSRWSDADGWGARRSLHCGCCTHPHNLGNGGHDFTAREWKARGECICPRFRDTGGVRVGDLNCPVHGAHGPEPLDGPWKVPADG